MKVCGEGKSGVFFWQRVMGETLLLCGKMFDYESHPTVWAAHF